MQLYDTTLGQTGHSIAWILRQTLSQKAGIREGPTTVPTLEGVYILGSKSIRTGQCR